jgi:hypothetical protein
VEVLLNSKGESSQGAQQGAASTTVYDTDAFWSAGNPTRLTVPAGVSKGRLKGNID